MIRLHRLPDGLSLAHPAALLSTWFGSGLIRPASGTWGSAAAIPPAAALLWFSGWAPWVLIPASLVAYLVGVWASGVFAQRLGVSDPSPVVIDEVAGQWLTLAFVPFDPLWWALGFFLFRAADIVKPFPANWADAKLHGGLGIMTDDMIAGFYAGVALLLAHRYVW